MRNKNQCQIKWIINLRSREFSKRWVIRVVWSWSWCFRESLNYRLTGRKRWSWRLCSKTSSRRVCEGCPFQGKSGRSESTVQSGRHFRRIFYNLFIRCHGQVMDAAQKKFAAGRRKSVSEKVCPAGRPSVTWSLVKFFFLKKNYF